MSTPSLNPYESPRYVDSPVDQSAGAGEFVMSGCMTVDDALAVHRLATRGYWLRIALVVLLILSFSIVLNAIAVSSRPYSPQASNVLFLVACVILPGLLLVPVAISRYRLYRLARNRFGIFAPTHTVFSAASIVSKSENAMSQLQWEAFSRCISNETVAIIYFKNSNQFLILARRKLENPSQWDSLLSLIKRRLEGCKDKPSR